MMDIVTAENINKQFDKQLVDLLTKRMIQRLNELDTQEMQDWLNTVLYELKDKEWPLTPTFAEWAANLIEYVKALKARIINLETEIEQIKTQQIATKEISDS